MSPEEAAAAGRPRHTRETKSTRVGSLRDAQLELTRSRLVEAALGLFGRMGYHAVTLERVAVAAGVSRGTIYLHYKNKAQLIRGVYESIRPELNAFYEELTRPKTSDQLRDFFGRVIDWWDDRAVLPFMLLREAAVDDDSLRSWVLAQTEKDIGLVAEIFERRGVPQSAADARAYALTCMWSEAAAQLRFGGIAGQQSRRTALRDVFVEFFDLSCEPR